MTGSACRRRLEAWTGRTREAVCGDRDNGFILVWNWNLMGDGHYTAVLVVDGKTISRNQFTVTTLGQEYIRGLERDVVVDDFPSPGESALLRWQEPVQGFVPVSPPAESAPRPEGQE